MPNLIHNAVLKKLFGLVYFSVLFFVVFGIRLFPIFNFRIAHGYNLDMFTHLSDLGRINYNLSLFSRFDWWINIVLFFPFPFSLRALVPRARIYMTIILGIFTSICIELLQFLLDIGLADINDVIANTIGVCIGLLLIRKLNGAIN